MANQVKTVFLNELKEKFGQLKKLEHSQSLFDLSQLHTRIYIRYSRKHSRNQGFFGLRQQDLIQLQGTNGLIVFLIENQRAPLIVPFADFEDVFDSIEPASDGQYKIQMYENHGIPELYISGAGRFNVAQYVGWDVLVKLYSSENEIIPDLTHTQVQSLIGGIGAFKGYNIWVPRNDRVLFDWNYVSPFHFCETFPSELDLVREVAEEIDVIWLDKGSLRPQAFFEVEHSTPIYTGLLRFNDMCLAMKKMQIGFSIVSNEKRRSLFMRQLRRPTFKASGLHNCCTFVEYSDIFKWYQRIQSKGKINGECRQ